jgi:ABC-type spermidine/putrescine transport system permease subunit I
MAVFSLREYSQVDLISGKFTFQNYTDLFSAYYFRLFTRTLRVALWTAVLSAILGFPIAYFIARATPRVKSVAIFLVISPLMISTVIRVFGTTLLLNPNGIVNQIIELIGLPPLRVLHTETAVVIGLIQMLIPFMVLPIVSALERIPVTLEEAAQNLGANWWRAFVAIILPLSLPGLVSGAILTYTLAVSALVIPALLGGAGDRMLGQQIYDQMFVAFNWPAASALSVTLVILTGILAAIALVLSARTRVIGGRDE